MMTFEEFRKKVIAEMEKRFDDADFSAIDMKKIQGKSYRGISVRPKNSNIGATVNLEEFYYQVTGKACLSTVYDNVYIFISAILKTMPEVNAGDLMDYNIIREKLALQLIPIAGNECHLDAIPYRLVEDMALVYRFEVDLGNGEIGTSLVTNSMLKKYNIDIERLHEDAMKFAPQNHPSTFRSVREFMSETYNVPLEMIPESKVSLWFGTVDGNVNGASVIMYPNFLSQVAEMLDGNIFVIPSSIHEVLFLKDDAEMNMNDLEKLIHSMNISEVKPDERLSDSLFYYNREKRVFGNARKIRE